MGNKLVTQAILIITSITIILTYIRPAFVDIADVQDDIARYESTVAKASELNAVLQDLIATEQGISARDSQRLRSYLPATIDNVVVMRDIQNIFKFTDVPIASLVSASADSVATPPAGAGARAGDGPRLVFRDFSLTFFGTYEQLKQVLEGLEVNAYPLEIVNLSFNSSSNPAQTEQDLGLPPDAMKYDLTLRTYALPDS